MSPPRTLVRSLPGAVALRVLLLVALCGTTGRGSSVLAPDTTLSSWLSALQVPSPEKFAVSSASEKEDFYRPFPLGFIECKNGGRTDGDHCVCPLYYTGDDCSARQCPNSVNGEGPYSILPVNNDTKFCDHCDTDNFGGMNCQKCKHDSACGLYAGSNAKCNKGLAIRGDNKQFQCSLENSFFINAMGDGRNISAEILLNCSTTDGTAFSDGELGRCSMAIYRVEPDDEYVDPFLRCDATKCSMKYGEVTNTTAEDEEHANKLATRLFRAIREGGKYTLIALCALLVLVGLFTRALGHRRLMCITAVLCVALSCVVLSYTVLMMLSMWSATPEKTVIYDCKKTKCACAENPPSKYKPFCSESSILNKTLPTVKNSIHLECGVNSGECKLMLTDLSLIFTADCAASECVDESKFPLTPSKESDTGDLWSHKHIVEAMAALMALCLAGIALHFFYLRRRAVDRAGEFLVLFNLPDGEVGGGPDVLNGDDVQPILSPLHTDSNLHVERGTAGHSLAAGAARESEADGDAQQEEAPLLGDSSARAGASVGQDSAAVSVQTDLLLLASRMTPMEQVRLEHIRHLTQSALELSVDRLRYSLFASCLADRSDSNSRVILNNVSFTVRSGEVLAIVGSSGAGKTTLLDILSARAKSGECSGSVLLNGTAIHTTGRRAAKYRNIIGYVSQEDTLLSSLTVRQTIRYAARLKLPRAFSRRTIRHIVDRMITVLKLKSCENTLVGNGDGVRGISGGEKRRVSIAVELLANPRILFLDEPTSGLDAVSAMRVVEAIVQLAKDSPMRQYAPHYFSFRPIVIFSIHQPSAEIYSLFDHILLLSKGVSVYCGAANSAAALLEARVSEVFGRTRPVPLKDDHPNPAEYLMKLDEILDDSVRAELQEMDVRSRARLHDSQRRLLDDSASAGAAAGAAQPKQLVPPGHAERAASADRQLTTTEEVSVNGNELLDVTYGFRVYYANVYQQLGLLTSRSVSCLIGSFHLVACHAAVVACLATLMSFLYQEQALDLPGALNRAGSCSFLLLVTSFVSLSCLEQLILERKLFVVERENGYYSTFPYLMSKMFVDILPLRVLPAVVLASVIYFPMGFRVDAPAHLCWFMLIVVLFSICMTLMVMCIGIVTGTFGGAALLSSVFILWNFVFGGSLVQADTIPRYLKPFKSLSPFFLAFEPLLVNELDGQSCVFSPTDETGKQSAATIPIMCRQYLANVGLKPSNFSTDVMQLGVYCFVFTGVAWLLLSATTGASVSAAVVSMQTGSVSPRSRRRPLSPQRAAYPARSANAKTDSMAAGTRAVPFASPMTNEFQWRNLYLRQFGTCAYAPPLPRNPSTTTSKYPKRKYLPNRPAATRTAPQNVQQPGIVRSVAAARADKAAAAADDGLSSCANSTTSYDGATSAFSGGPTMLDAFLAGEAPEDEADLLTGQFFGFLNRPDQSNAREISVASSVGTSRRRSGTNPLSDVRHEMEDERFGLHREAWMMLMDNRALCWLEREAREKGQTAANVRQRLLEVLSASCNPGLRRLPASRSGLKSITARNAAGDESTSETVPSAPAADAATQVVAAADATAYQVLAQDGPPMSMETAQQQVYEGFQPFFAVISPPAVLRRLRDQFNSHRRAQQRGLPGVAADVVGLPLFSQFASWREAYQHRKTWESTPYSFFLIHDVSYNYAHISAVYVLLRIISSHCHTHVQARCVASGGNGEAVVLENASHLLTNEKSIRRAAEWQRTLCPIMAVQQVTEDILLAYEQSSARSALTMAMCVLGFLTDTVLDAETAARFVSAEAVKRQNNYVIPGMNVVATADAGAQPSTTACDVKDTASGEGPTAVPDAEAGGSGGRETSAQPDADPQHDSSPADPAVESVAPSFTDALVPKQFTEEDFNALFDLTFWFIDTATANSRIPVNPALLPGGAKPGAIANGSPQSPTSLHGSMSPGLDGWQSSEPPSFVSGARAESASGTRLRSALIHRSLGASVSMKESVENASTPRASASLSLMENAAGKGSMTDHLYIPGRIQQYNPVGSLVEALILFECRREELLAGQVAESLDARAGTAAMENTRRTITRASEFSEYASKKSTAGTCKGKQKQPAAGAAVAVTTLEEIRSTHLSASTTMLSTPLIFMTSYIRLHGAQWLKHLFGRLFNILRRESVLLYVNRLDFDGVPSARPGSERDGALAGQSLVSVTQQQQQQPLPSPHASRLQGAARGAGESPTAAATATAAAAARLGRTSLTSMEQLKADDEFHRHLERLEDLVTQDILFVLHEFFSALHGKRSATRLPQGITSLVTQFVSTVHLHLLGGDAGTSEGSSGSPGAAARKVKAYAARLRQMQTATKSVRYGGAVQNDASVTRLIRSIEQFRLAKFILFDCWIIPSLTNAVSAGYVAESSSKHLRWNIDAFARYLKILVNSPFMDDYDAVTHALARDAAASSSAADENPRVAPSPLEVLPHPNSASQSTKGQSGTRGAPRKKKAPKEVAKPPYTLPLPRYITGVYDISSGSLIHLQPVATATTPTLVEASFSLTPTFAKASVTDSQDHPPIVELHDTENASPSNLSFSASAGWDRDDPSGLQRMAMSSSAAGGTIKDASSSGMPVRSGNISAGSAAASLLVSNRASPEGLRGSVSGPSTAGTLTTDKMSSGVQLPVADVAPPSVPLYTVMDEASWESVSPALKRLNEALGIVGYDPEEDEEGDYFHGRDTLPTSQDGSVGNGRPAASQPPDGVRTPLMKRREGLTFEGSNSPMRVLDLFCRGASEESARNVVVSEFEVLPTTAAGCVDSVYEMMSGQHMLVEQALRSTDIFPRTFGFSPYLACLYGVLLHPKSAAKALDNTYHNSPPFYQALMRPVEDEGILGLASALVIGQDDLPLLDTNAVAPLLASVAARGSARRAASRLLGTSRPDGAFSHTGVDALAVAEWQTLQRCWEQEATRLKRQRFYLATGADVSGERTNGGYLSSMQRTLDAVGPPNPFNVLKAGSLLIEREARLVPTCFDPWWRAMALALCVKAMTVFTECTSTRSEAFDRHCNEQLSAARRDNRTQREAFVKEKGAGEEICLADGRDNSKSAADSGKASQTASGARQSGAAASRTAKAGTKSKTVKQKVALKRRK